MNIIQEIIQELIRKHRCKYRIKFHDWYYLKKCDGWAAVNEAHSNIRKRAEVAIFDDGEKVDDIDELLTIAGDIADEVHDRKRVGLGMPYYQRVCTVCEDTITPFVRKTEVDMIDSVTWKNKQRIKMNKAFNKSMGEE